MKLINFKTLGSVFFIILLCCSYKCSPIKEVTVAPPSVPAEDGPYVFIEDDGFRSITGIVKGHKFKYQEQTLTADQSINVNLPSMGISFDVPLRSEHKADTSHFEMPAQVFAISDIEGDFDFFTSLLISNRVIDKDLNWSFGSGHLVILGDTFDRGHSVTQLLWLIYKLEKEANNVGGKVHFILGNHETMNLTGDDRYIHEKYRTVCSTLRLQYSDLYDTNTVLGDWLRSKNSIVTIDRLLFVHGGISPVMMMNELKPHKANEMIRSAITDYNNRRLTKEEKFLIGAAGPLWYRDMVLKRIRYKDLINVMYYYQADHVIVGHTLVEKIGTAFEGRVIAIDVDRRASTSRQGLFVDDGKLYVADSKGVRTPLL